MLQQAAYRVIHTPVLKRDSFLYCLLADVEESVIQAGQGLLKSVAFLGEVAASIVKSVTHPF